MVSEQEQVRYSRQIMLREIGMEGQKRLKMAKVVIVGIGGLGSITSSYLSAAGIGYLVVIDQDSVGLSNLNRQILYACKDIGKRKAKSAKQILENLNPGIIVRYFDAELTRDNCSALIGRPDAVVDGTDNLKTRKVLNQYCIMAGIPLIFGGVEGFDGMVTTILPGKTPCLDCIFPGNNERPGEKGVVGPLAGLIASIQSIEVVKLLLNQGKLLDGRLLQIRGMEMRFKEIHIQKSPDCNTCGQGC